MGSSSSGVLIKKVLTESDLDQVFGKELIKMEEKIDLSSCLDSIMDQKNIVVANGKDGTVILHNYRWHDNYTKSFRDDLQQFVGCTFGWSSVSMAGSFLHYVPEGIYQDDYEFVEDGLINEGPNILGITKNMEFMFEDVGSLIQKYIGHWDTWTDATYYTLGSDLPEYRLKKNLEDFSYEFNYSYNSSVRLLRIWTSALLMEYDSDCQESINEHRMIRYASAYELSKREIEIQHEFNKYFEDFKNEVDDLKILNLEELQLRKGELEMSLESRSYELEFLQRYIATVSVLNRIEGERNSVIENDKSFNNLVIIKRNELKIHGDNYLKYMYLYVHSKFFREEIRGEDTKVLIEAIQQELLERDFLLTLTTKRYETQEYFFSFLNPLIDAELMFIINMLSSNEKEDNSTESVLEYPLTKALIDIFKLRKIESKFSIFLR